MMNQGVNNIGGCGMVVGGPSGFLPADPIHVMRSGQVRKDVRVMAGATKHDGTFMVTGLYDILAAMELINSKQSNQYDLIDTANRMFGIDEHSGALAGYEIESLFTEQQLASGNFTQLMAGVIDVSILFRVTSDSAHTMLSSSPSCHRYRLRALSSSRHPFCEMCKIMHDTARRKRIFIRSTIRVNIRASGMGPTLRTIRSWVGHIIRMIIFTFSLTLSTSPGSIQPIR